MAQSVRSARRKSAKKTKRTLSRGQVHIYATFNNTIVTVTDHEGNTVTWGSAGSVGFRGSRKSTPFAARLATEQALNAAMVHPRASRAGSGCKTWILVDHADFFAFTAGRGSPRELVSSLPKGRYRHFLDMLANRNPFALKAAEAGRPYRALVHVFISMAFDSGWRMQPGLAIQCMPSLPNPRVFQGLSPPEFTSDLGHREN